MVEEGVCEKKTGSVLRFDSDSRFLPMRRVNERIEDGKERESDDRPMCVLG